MNFLNVDNYPHLAKLITEVMVVWPEHGRVIERSLIGRDAALLAHSDQLAKMISLFAEGEGLDLRKLADDYRFLCEQIIVPEEWHFRRNGCYRLSSFQDALDQVYNNKALMARYMTGLLTSNVLWLNHANASFHYSKSFLPQLKNGAALLEVGPGHGLFMYLASNEPRVTTLTGWDVSETSLDLTRRALKCLAIGRGFALEQRNVFEPVSSDGELPRFDAIVFSEVLEHLEEPLSALKSLFALTRPGGKIWVNVPANSPAPDHIFLLRHPSEAADLVRSAGFEIVDAVSFPTAGATLERAIKQKLTISCVVVGERPRGASQVLADSP